VIQNAQILGSACVEGLQVARGSLSIHAAHSSRVGPGKRRMTWQGGIKMRTSRFLLLAVLLVAIPAAYRSPRPADLHATDDPRCRLLVDARILG
jgi:hypothetical protein